MKAVPGNDSKGNLLVIDDDPIVQEILEEILIGAGYNVTSLPDGHVGLTAAEDEQPDLILLDVRLSEIDGIEVCRELKSRKRTLAIPVIFISGLHDVEDKIRGFTAGGVDYITKPFSPEEILARVAAHLTISRSRRQIEIQNARLEQEILRAREAEERAKRWAGEWEATFNSMTDLVSLQDPDFTITRVNKAFAEALEREPVDIIGKKCFEVVHGTSEPSATCPMVRALKCGKPVTEELIEPRLGRCFQVTVASRCNDKGVMIGVIHVAKDVTARRKAEEALRRSEEKHRFIAENLDDVIWQVGPDDCFTYVSPSIRRLGDYEPEAMVGTRFSAYLSENSRRIAKGAVPGPGRTKEDWSGFVLELEFLARDGSLIPIEVKYSGSRDRSGRHLSYQGVARDIRDRKRAERERQRLVAAIEHAAEAFYMMSTDGVIEYVNRSFCGQSGYTKEELLGNKVDLITTESVERSFYDKIWSRVSSGETWSGRWARKKRDGTVYQIEGSIVPIKDDTGAITSYAAVTRDITEQLLLQEELQQSQKMEAMGALAGGIAHDFNNILAAIMGNAELALEDVPVASETHGNLQGVLKAGMRGRDLVKQILAFTRKTRAEKRSVPLAPLIKETHDLLRASIPATIEMALSIDAVSDTVEADPVQIQQVLLNLATNAADAMDDGRGGKMATRLFNSSFAHREALPDKGMTPGEYVVLEVSDTGCGISEQVKKRVFEPFFSTKKPGRGTGMGLAVVYGIVKDASGFITIRSRPGAGSTFTVYFPRAKSVSRARPGEKQTIQQGRRERLLFVDDEEPIVQVGTRMLRRIGYDVTAAQSSAEALEIFRREPLAIDLVITDQTMPGMTGLALVEELRRIRPDIPIVLCSGRTDLMSSQQAKKLGIGAYVTKPFRREELAAAIQTVLGERES